METLEMLQNEEEILDKFNTSISHGIYVSNLAYFLGTAIGLDESACHELAIAGLLHDIGKIKASRLLYVDKYIRYLHKYVSDLFSYSSFYYSMHLVY